MRTGGSGNRPGAVTAVARRRAGVLVLAAVLAAGCAGGGPDTAVDPASPGDSPSTGADPGGEGTAPSESPTALPTRPPAAAGAVRTRGPVTVVQQPGAPTVVCLGVTTMIHPPRCDGPPLRGWDWSQHRSGSEQAEGVRFGTFALTGRWDGRTLTVTRATPAGQHEPSGGVGSSPGAGPASPTVSPEVPESRRRQVARAITDRVPWVRGAAAVGGRVRVDVVHDDGQLQRALDRAYPGVEVVVVSRLVDAG